MSETQFSINRADLSVRMERVFKAPVEEVFRAYIDPNMLVQWWGRTDENEEVRVEKMDPQVGGEWRFITQEIGGTEFGFHGVIKEFK